MTTIGRSSTNQPFLSSVAPTYGLAAFQQFDKLPYLQLTTQAGGQSSYQRNTAPPDNGNHDWDNFLYAAGAENVMLDLRGPGTVYRIWATGFAQTDWIKVHFDGEATPRINLSTKDFFSGSTSPFLAPLAGNDIDYSGGSSITCRCRLRVLSVSPRT